MARILAISGGGYISSAFYLELAQKVGALLTLRKPFERMEILNAVNQLLQGGEKR